MVGRTIGRYRIEERLGSGGMGVVYKASDTLLKRPVAIKVLADKEAFSADHLKRFLQEAQMASSLAHPNICTVHDYGELEGKPYFVMELLHGRSLQARVPEYPLPPSEALEITLQAARGLEAAHAQGVVHRDIKPGNIFITQEGEIKIVDFGVAKKAVLQEAGSGDTGTQLTRDEGALMGTFEYMSPEQALGKPVDGRSDLFSLGVVFYEMLGGNHPFRSPTVVATLDRVINSPPQPSGRTVAIAPELRRIVRRLLEKDPSNRFSSARQLIDELESFKAGKRKMLAALPDRLPSKRALAVLALLLLAALTAWGAWLWWSAGETALPGPSAVAQAKSPVVGVLPLVNLSGDSSLSRVGLGISHTLITSLSNLGSVTMISPSTTLRLGTEERGAAQIARDLGAEYLVTGSVQQAKDRLLVTLQLNKNDSVVWGGDTEGSLEDLFELQHRLAQQVANVLHLALSEDDRKRLEMRPTLDNEAFAEYLQARAFLERPDVEGNQQRAIQLFRSAIERDESFALAYAGLGDAYWAMYEKTRDADWADKARHAIQRALQLDPQRPEVRISLAVIYEGTGQNEKAIEELRGALRQQPNNDDAHRLLGNVLKAEGRSEEAIESYRQAIAFRPDYWGNYRALGLAYFDAGRYQEAITAFRRITELQPDSVWGYQSVGVAHHAAGNLDDAISWYTRALAEGPSAAAYSNLGTIHYRRGEFEKAARNYEKALEMHPARVTTLRNLGDAYSRLGLAEKAGQCYQRAIDLIQDTLQVNAKDARQLGLMALLEAKLGCRQGAVGHVDEAVALAPEDSQVLYRQAVVRALCGDREAALQALASALERGYSRSEAQLDDDLAALRGLPAYQRIIQTSPSKEGESP
ncbi:MAG TPA: tetratricopeptide repeat protein [Acidobacteriota bacterium]|nr:tetratricopeptide repeat protein [Acidobacteriota bacterium]